MRAAQAPPPLFLCSIALRRWPRPKRCNLDTFMNPVSQILQTMLSLACFSPELTLTLSLSFQHPALTSIFNNVQRIDCSYCLSLRFHFFFFPHPTNDLHNLAADLPSRFQNFQYISPPPINMCKGIQKSYSCGCSQPTQTYYRCPDRKRTKTICPGNDPDDDMVMRVDICLNCMEKNDWAA